MSTFSRAESQCLYSWWWDSHISPKNSKWLKENLTDMDAKVKLMIKLIEEDADSFAKRAEMYYKKRPELMKLVEEFYRAYRALAERYDHATGALRQAHKTMEEAQIPFVPAENSPTGSSSTEYEPHKPEMPHPSPASSQPDELHKDALDLSPSLLYAFKRPVTYSSERDSIRKKGLKQLNDLFVSGEGAVYHVKFAEAIVTKGLNFDGEEKQGSNQTLKSHITSESEQTHEVQSEVQTLKEALAKLEAEKEADLPQYQQALARLSNLETEVFHAQDDARGLNERATKADAEVQVLNQALAKLQAEKEDSLKQYQQCLDRISCLETKLSSGPEDAGGPGERTSKAESEVQNLKQAYARLEAEKKVNLLQYKHLSETISSLETKLAHAEEDSRSLNERAIRAETEVKFLKESIAKLEEDKEAAAFQYQRSLERISYLEGEVSQAQEEATRLSHVIVMGVAKLSSTEEQYLILERETQYLQSEVNDLVEKMAFQEQELVEKNEELRRLQFCTQQEFMLSMEAEATLDRYQEEQQTLELELENEVQRMKEMELRYQLLEEEIQQIKEENKTLEEQKPSSAFSMKEVDDETTSLTEMDERNALQQEIHHLKEQLNGLNKGYLGLIEQVKLVGLEPDHFGSSVKDLQEENSRLKEMAEKESHEKVALFKKVENMENLSGKNALLENSLSDLTVRLEALREKSKALEETCRLLQREISILVVDKDTLLAQLETATENAGLLSRKDALLESSLSDANAELEGLRSKLKSLEEFCKSLENEKSGLVTEREIMFAQLNTIQERLEGVETRYTALEERYLVPVKENESRVHQLKKLQTALDLEKQEHASFTQSSKSLVAYLRGDVEILRDKGEKTKEEFEEEQDRSIRAQLEIIILHSCLQDMEGKNHALFMECQKHFEASMSLEKLLTELRKKNIEEQVKVKSLLNQIGRMRLGIRRMFTIKSASDYDCQDKFEDDEILLELVLSKMRDLENHLMETHDEKQQLLLEKSVLLTLLGQMRFDTVNLVSERNILDKDLKCMTEELHMQRTAKQVILGTNEQLRLELTSKNQQQMELKAEMENQSMELSTLQEVYPLLQNVNSKLLEANKSLVKEVANAQKETCRLEEENGDLIEEVMNLSNLFIVFSKFGAEKVAELKEHTEDVNHLNGVNDGLEKKVRKMAEMLTIVRAESLLHKESVEKLDNEISVLRSESAHLNHLVDTGKSLLNQKEVELSETNHRLDATESENLELLGKLEDLMRDCKEARATKEVLEKQILELHEEIKNQRVKEDDLSFDLHQQSNETKLWEEEAATIYGDCQATDFYADILREKVTELVEACKSLEDGITSKTRDREQMKERLDVLDGESEGMKSQLAACLPLMESLRDSILSLEDHVLPLTKTHVADKSETKVCLACIRLHENSCKELNGNQCPMLRDGVSSLLELQTMVKAIQNSVVEKTRLVAQESSDMNAKLEAAMKEIEELRSRRYSAARVEDVKAGGSTGTEQEKLGEEHCNPESSGSEILMKDIPLDQASHSSSYDRGSGLHALSGIIETDDEMLESFLPAEQDCNLSLAYKTPEVTNNFLQIEVVEQHKSEHPSPDLQTEELLVDKLIISKRHSGLHGEGNERKILKRIASDVQKLRNLQVAVQDLKKKVEQFEKSKKAKKSDKGKDMEYAILKVELKEVEEAVMQLLDVNQELTKSITQLPFVPDEKGVLKLEEKGRVLRRSGFSEQAEHGSEKIGRLQLEVQRIQFVLLRIEDGHKTKGSKISDRRVQLRDYLYGPGRSYSNSRKRKAPLFACVKPPMESD